MRISPKMDYAVRGMAQLAADGPCRATVIADAQDIPFKFLVEILATLGLAGLVTVTPGADSTYALSRPAAEISLADVFRAIEGQLANVRDLKLTEISYPGPAARVPELWMAVRTSLRSVLEHVTLADLVAQELPPRIQGMVDDYLSDERYKA